ncbi:hypothetical protein TNCV_1532251 [Trichonephila clavipes]|nr:hypothetical protein TNCV_1532251 [Trichonephila clavipes]
MICHTYSIEDRSGDLARQGNMSTVCRAHCVTTSTMTPVVGPVCLGHRQFGCRRSPGLILTNTRPSLAPKGRTFFHQKTQQISTPSSNELWLDTIGIANGNGLE